MPLPEVEKYIKEFDLERHIEGGCFKRIYYSNDVVKPLDERFKGETRQCGGTIYFLLEEHDFSAFHRLKSDEIWNYCDGATTHIYIIDDHGNLSEKIVGNPSIHKGASFHAIVPSGTWFAAEVGDKKSFSLVLCTCFPGFDYADFELANMKTLSTQFPQHQSLIQRLTRS
jgi:predicted cupin superfamily sugar epimerase